MRMLNRIRNISMSTLIGLLGLVTLASAAWVFAITGEVSRVTITSEEPLTYTSYFDTQVLAAEPFTQTVEDTIEIVNSDGTKDLQFDWVESVVDNTTDTCDNSGDVAIRVEWNNETLSTGDTKVMGMETGTLVVAYDVVAHACGQEASVDMNVTVV